MGKSKSRSNGHGGARVRAEDADRLTVLLDARDKAVAHKNRAEIALATALQDYNEFNQAMIRKYKLGLKDGVTIDGNILRNIEQPVAGPRTG
jgi:hypothetical protein